MRNINESEIGSVTKTVGGNSVSGSFVLAENKDNGDVINDFLAGIEIQNLQEFSEKMNLINERSINIIRLLNLLNSEKGKKILYFANKSNSKTSKTIKEILRYGNKLKESLKSGNQDINIGDISSKIYDYMLDEESLYERILLENLLEKRRMSYSVSDDLWEIGGFAILNEERKKRKIGSNEVNKWTALTKEVIHDKPREYIDLFVDVFGFVPREIYTKLGFYKHRNFAKVSEFYALLEKKQQKSAGNEDAVWKIKNARSLFLRYSILEKMLDSGERIPGTFEQNLSKSGNLIYIDTNGLKLELSDAGKTVNSHIPWSELSEELLNYLLKANFLTYPAYLEASRKYLQQSGKFAADKLAAESQIDICIKSINANIDRFPKLSEAMRFNDSNESFISKKLFLSKALLYEPDSLGKLIFYEGLIIPQEIFDLLDMIPNSETPYKASYCLFSFAHTISGLISKEVAFDSELVFSSYEEMLKYLDGYRNSLENMNDPRKYPAYRAIQTFFNKDIPENSLQDEFFVYRGEYRSGRKSKSFVEMKYKGNSPVRMLVDDNKHMNGKAGENFQKIHHMEKDEYERINIFLQSFSVFKKSVNSLNSRILGSLQNPGNAPDFHFLRHESRDDILNIRSFFLNYFPENLSSFDKYINELSDLSKTHKNDSDHILHISHEFLDFLFSVIKNIKSSTDRVMHKSAIPENLKESLTKKTIRYDESFLKKITEKGLQSYAYDSDLCSCANDVDIVEIISDSSKPTATAISEIKALQLLAIDHKKRLVVVSGGCKHMDGGQFDPTEKMSKAIVKAAGKMECNLSIPCTQSGIGVSMSKSYLNHLDLVAGEETGLHMFSVAPGKNVYYGEDSEKENSLYALNPIDSIIIKNSSSGWDLNGKELKNAGYFDFIEWLELIYHKLDKNKDRIHVIGNGGLFTIAEALAGLRNSASMILVKDSGRFAQAASAFFELSGMEYMLKNNPDFATSVSFIEDLIKNNMPQTDFDEWIEKDWGNLDPNYLSKIGEFKDFDEFYNYFCANLKPGEENKAKFLLYRKLFLDFISEAMKSKMYSRSKLNFSTIDELESNILNSVK